MEYCCYVWVGAPSCYLELLDKLQKRICWTADPSLAASLEPLVHCQNVASLSLFYRYHFGRCSSKLAQLAPRFLILEGGLLAFLIDCMIFLSQFLKTSRNGDRKIHVYANSFIPGTARLWDSLPMECFPLTYDLNGLKSITNRHFLTLGSF